MADFSKQNVQVVNNNDELDIKELLLKYIVYWKWFVISVVLCLVGAFLYLKTVMPVYNVASSIMIKDESKGGSIASELTLMKGVDLMGNSMTENEMEVLMSKSLVRDVVKAINGNIIYIMEGMMSKRDVYDQSPIVFDQTQFRADELGGGYLFELTAIDSLSFDMKMVSMGEVVKEEKVTSLPYVVETDQGKLTLNLREGHSLGEFKKLDVTVANPITMARSFLGKLSVAPASKISAVLKLSIKETNPKRGVDFLDKLVELYNLNAIEDKNKVAMNTAIFIEERIKIISKELGSSERAIENYKKREGLTDISSNASLFMHEGTNYERKQVENETQLKLIRFLREYMSEENKVLPTNIGITDAALLSQIGKYNELLLDRNRLLRTTSDNNPVVLSQNAMIEALHENIQTLIANLEDGILIAQKDLDKQTQKYKEQVGNVPTQERRYIEIDRQRQIQSSLFLILLQKREENALAMAATTNKAKIIDESLADPMPIAPKTKIIYLVALILGLAIPVAILYIREMFNVTFSSSADLERMRLTSLPVLAELPDFKKLKNVREEDQREAFRLLRTNVRFMLDENRKVVLITSSIFGEGKTFVSSNLALSFSMLGKKTLLVGGDLRNPRLGEIFKKTKEEGLSSYLSGGEKDIHALITHVEDNPNLDVLFAGPIPPNSAELLSRDTMDTLMEQLRSEYDYIIFDTAPVGLVTDALVLSRVADVTLYVTRADYTNKQYLSIVNQLAAEEKFPNVSLLVNSVDQESKRYGYGRYGYGYGHYGNYGYGYGNYSYSSSTSEGK